MSCRDPQGVPDDRPVHPYRDAEFVTRATTALFGTVLLGGPLQVGTYKRSDGYDGHPPQAQQLQQWIVRVLAAANISLHVVLLGIHYLYERTLEYAPFEYHTSVPHLIAVAFMLSNKFLIDVHFSNRTWSMITGIDLPTLNRLEMQWLQTVGYSMFNRKNCYPIATLLKNWERCAAPSPALAYIPARPVMSQRRIASPADKVYQSNRRPASPANTGH